MCSGVSGAASAPGGSLQDNAPRVNSQSAGSTDPWVALYITISLILNNPFKNTRHWEYGISNSKTTCLSTIGHEGVNMIPKNDHVSNSTPLPKLKIGEHTNPHVTKGSPTEGSRESPRGGPCSQIKAWWGTLLIETPIKAWWEWLEVGSPHEVM